MGRVYHLREARKEEMEEMREYPDDAHLMDIYSFPEYQVEVEVATIVDSPSKPVTLDEAIKDVVDPVILGNTGVSIYEIPMEKIKLPMDEGVNVKDLGVDDNDYPNDTHPVEMATPAPNQKVWLDSDINRVNPMSYDKAVATTD
jgi:hypothetical protein